MKGKNNIVTRGIFEFLFILIFVNGLTVFVKWDIRPENYSWEERLLTIIVSILIFTILQKAKFFHENEEE